MITEVRIEWYRQAYLEDRPENVLTEFKVFGGERHMTFDIPRFFEDRSNVASGIIGYLNSMTDAPVICEQSR